MTTAQHDIDAAEILKTLADLRGSLASFKELLAVGAGEHFIQYIPALLCEDDEDGYKYTVLSGHEYHPQNTSLDEIDLIYSTTPPSNHSINSLPRYAGYITLKAEYAEKVLNAANELNATKRAFSKAVEAQCKATGDKQYRLSYTAFLRKHEIIESENFEMLTRPIIVTDNMALDALNIRWNINHYSQPKKLTAAEFIEQAKNQDLKDVQAYLSEAVTAASQLSESTVLKKRFYSPPYVTARFRYTTDAQRGELNAWEEEVYPSTPLIVHSLSSSCKVKAKLPDLTPKMINGTVLVEVKPNGKPFKLPKRLHPALDWFIQE